MGIQSGAPRYQHKQDPRLDPVSKNAYCGDSLVVSQLVSGEILLSQTPGYHNVTHSQMGKLTGASILVM